MKKILFWLIGSVFVTNFAFASAPTFDEMTSDLHSNDVIYDNLDVSADNSLEQNIQNLFYPDSSSPGKIRTTMRIVMVGLLVLFLVRAGVLFMMAGANDAEIKKARMNLLYIGYGALLFFGATWVLGTALNITQTSGSASFVDKVQNNVLFQVLVFLKAFAFFVAIIMIVYYGYRIMQAYEKDDKIKEGKNGVINVIMALIFIKVIDYIYYIAQQHDAATKMSTLILSVSRVAGYVLGILLVLTIIYAGMQLITSGGSEEKWKKAQGAIKTVFLVSMMIFLFLLIIYQILSEISF